MSTTKPFKTINEQIQILQDRNLTLTEHDLEKAKNFLMYNSYYRISGYTLTLRKNDRFHNGITINHIIQIFEADKRMRHLLLHYLETIEIRLKALISYLHTEKYGPLGYLDINTFNCMTNNNVAINIIQDYIHITRKASAQQNANYNSEHFIKHHIDNKNGKFPFWVYIELLTISDISKLYTLLTKDLQQSVAQELGFSSIRAINFLQTNFHCIAILRNICAHGGRLYYRQFIRKPHLSKTEKKLLRTVNNTPILDRLFSFILIIKSLIDKNEFNELKAQLIKLEKDYPLAYFKNYGFPDNWKDILE